LAIFIIYYNIISSYITEVCCVLYNDNAIQIIIKHLVLASHAYIIAIDTETDSFVQETIKEVFSDCTMLTIADRLNTITNYDGILVLDQGQVCMSYILMYISNLKSIINNNSQHIAVAQSSRQF